MKPLLKAGDRIEGLHWVAEYRHRARLIRVLRERVEVGTYGAPSALFGDEEEMARRRPPITAAAKPRCERTCATSRKSTTPRNDGA